MTGSEYVNEHGMDAFLSAVSAAPLGKCDHCGDDALPGGERLPYIQAVKEGRMRPKRCGICDYCRATKRIESIKPYYTLMPEFREAKEDEVNAESVLHDPLEAGGLGSVSSVRDTDCLDQNQHGGMDTVQ